MASSLSNNVIVNRAALIKRMEGELKEIKDAEAKDQAKFTADKATLQPKVIAALKKALANAEKGRIEFLNGNVNVPGLPYEPRLDRYRSERREREAAQISSDLEVIKMHINETINVGHRSRWARYL